MSDREHVQWLADHFIGADADTRRGALSPLQQMQVLLRYFSDPGFQRGVGEDLGIYQTTVCKTVTKVLGKVMEKACEWITFPTSESAIQIAKNEWQEAFRMPGAISVLDCTHVRIEKPTQHGDEYINRKGYRSINVHATCNAKGIFTSVDATWPGPVNDGRIWINSDVKAVMISRNALLLGDEGYGIAPWLMTPFKHPTSEEEEAYNRLFAHERALIERTFGQVKR